MRTGSAMGIFILGLMGVLTVVWPAMDTLSAGMAVAAGTGGLLDPAHWWVQMLRPMMGLYALMALISVIFIGAGRLRK